jgi:hypothetical protein
MLRALCLTVALGICTACGAPSESTEPLPNTAVTIAPRQTLRGIIRSTTTGTTRSWALELADGSMVKLVSGPVATYVALENKEAVVVGVYSDGVMIVDTCAQFEAEYNRRR